MLHGLIPKRKSFTVGELSATLPCLRMAKLFNVAKMYKSNSQLTTSTRASSHATASEIVTQ